MRNFLRDCTFLGPALPDPFVQFELENELNKLELLPATIGATGRELGRFWDMYRRKLRPLISGGSIRVRNHVLEPLLLQLGYERIISGGEISTREGLEEGGDLLLASQGSFLRVWCTEYDEDLDAPTRRGAAYRFSHLQVARRVLRATQERIGLLTNGTELRVIIMDLARTDSEIQIRIDPAWKDPKASEIPDSLLLLLALASPAGVRALSELVDKARLQQARVTKELRAQARRAVEGFLQEILNHPENQSKLESLDRRHALAPELWREALIVIYRLLFILKLESTDDPARSFKFSTSTLWRNTFSPTSALPRFVRKVLEEGAVSGSFLEESVRKLFQMFVDGLECSELHVRPLGGTLFGQQATPLLSDMRWGERAVAQLLDNLLWTTPKHRANGRERVHYGSLDVEDLGRVYEALLELEPGVATEAMCRLRRRKLEVVVPAAQGERYRTNVPLDTDAEVQEEVDDEQEEVEEEAPTRGKKTKVEWIEEIPAGKFYLRVGLGRKASGSYYTPQSFVRFLVQQTLEPLVEERSPKTDPKPSEILRIKVLDPAMGSGHFLVEACRFLGSKLYEAARLCDERLAQAKRTADATQNDQIRHQALRDVTDYSSRLAAFLPADANLPGYLPTSAPEAGESTGISQKHAEAICRRLIAIHCLYGVDKNPLGVELAKVALWIESHSEGLPLTFLDHRLVLGDSITGPFFTHLLTYPGNQRPMDDLLTQGLREKFSAALSDAIALVGEIESTLCSTMPDFEAKARLRDQMETKLAPFKVAAAAWAGGVMLGERCDDDAYAELVRTVAETGALPSLFDERLREMIGRGFGVRSVCESSVSVLQSMKAGQFTTALPFELAFPEVFFPRGSLSPQAGFDVVLGNPPWDAIRPKAKEFFATYDFEILAAPTKRERSSIEKQLKSSPAVAVAYEEYQRSFDQQRRIHEVLFRHQVAIVQEEKTGGDPDAAKFFLERNAQLLRETGQTGVVVPSGFHANEGATALRKLYFEQMSVRCCYSFENRKQLFEIHRSFKFAMLVAGCGRRTENFSCAFYLHDDEWLFREDRNPEPLRYSLEFVRRTGGEYLTLIELRNTRDFELATCLFAASDRFGRFCNRFNIVLGRELHMTDDAWRFTPSAEVIGVGDPRPQCLETAKSGWLVLDEGKNFWQFDDCWGEAPRYLVAIEKLRDRPLYLKRSAYFRLAYRSIASSTNERTAVFVLLPPGLTCGHSVATEQEPQGHRLCLSLATAAIGNTFVFDWTVRQIVSANVTQYQLFSAPVPHAETLLSFLAHQALRLTCNHQGYEALWRNELGNVWRETNSAFSWPIFRNEDQRWEVRATIDAIVAHAYCLDREKYEHVLSGFNHKGYRRAPELCLTKLDELKTTGIEAFTRKYDPYWDIPLNESLPEPLINIPIPAREQEHSQQRIAFTEGSSRPAGSTAISQQHDGELYLRLHNLLTARRQVTNADVQSALGCTAAQAHAALKRLVEEHHAVVEGRGRATRYLAVTNAEAAHGNSASRTD